MPYNVLPALSVWPSNLDLSVCHTQTFTLLSLKSLINMLLSKLFSNFFLRCMQEQPEPFSNTRIVCIVSCSKTKEKRPNYGKYSQTGITVEINTNHDGFRTTALMLRSIAAGLSLRSPVIAVKQASEITSAALRVNNWELTLTPFQCVEWKATSVSAAKFHGAVTASNLYVPVNSTVVHLWNTALSSLFSNYHAKKNRVCLWASTPPNFKEYFPFRFYIRDLKNFRQKC